MILAKASDAASTVGSEQTETPPTPKQTGGEKEEDVANTSVTAATPRRQNFTTFEFKSGSSNGNPSFPFKILVVAALALAGMVSEVHGPLDLASVELKRDVLLVRKNTAICSDVEVHHENPDLLSSLPAQAPKLGAG